MPACVRLGCLKYYMVLKLLLFFFSETFKINLNIQINMQLKHLNNCFLYAFLLLVKVKLYLQC